MSKSKDLTEEQKQEMMGVLEQLKEIEDKEAAIDKAYEDAVANAPKILETVATWETLLQEEKKEVVEEPINEKKDVFSNVDEETANLLSQWL